MLIQKKANTIAHKKNMVVDKTLEKLRWGEES